MSGRNLPRVDLYRKLGFLDGGSGPLMARSGWRWRLWKGSRIVGSSSESYTEKRGALENLETVCNGTFKRIAEPAHPEPYGLLSRVSNDGVYQVIPVRLKGSP